MDYCYEFFNNVMDEIEFLVCFLVLNFNINVDLDIDIVGFFLFFDDWKFVFFIVFLVCVYEFVVCVNMVMGDEIFFV